MIMPSDEYLGPYWWEVGQHWFRIKPLPEPMLTQICVSIWSVGHTELKDKPSQIGCLSWLNGNKSGYRPWKVLKFDSCLEKCLIVQSALQAGNFPWKVLENDFMEKYRHHRSNLFMCCFSHWCEKSNAIQLFCHQIFITTDPVSGVFHSAIYQINLFLCKILCHCIIIEI